MSFSANVTIKVSCMGLEVSGSFAPQADMGIEPVSTSLPAGKQSTAWTKSDADTGTATLATGHGLLTADVVDVYWEDGVRYGMTAAVSSDDVTVEGGAGDELPASSTVVIVSKISVIPSEFDGDNLVLLIAKLAARGHIAFIDAGAAVLKAHEFLASEPLLIVAGSGLANPLTGNPVAEIHVSNGTTTAADFNLTGLQDAIT